MAVVPFVLLQVLIFAGLVLLLRQFIGRHVTSATSHLQALSQDYLKKQDELKKRLEEADRYYQEQLAKAQAESDQLKRQVLEETEATHQRLLAKAHQESERIVRQAMESKDALRRELEQMFEQRAWERACRLLCQTLPASLRQQIHTHWMEDLMRNGLGRLERLRVADDCTDVHMVSAFPLTTQQREFLQRQLSLKFGHAVMLKEETEPRLVAGLRLLLGNLVFDGSLASKFQEAAHRAQEALRE